MSYWKRQSDTTDYEGPKSKMTAFSFGAIPVEQTNTISQSSHPNHAFSNKFSNKSLGVPHPSPMQVLDCPYKPAVSRFVNLDTRFAFDSSDTTPVPMNFAKYVLPLPSRLDEVRSMKIKNIEIPVSFDPFSSYLDNVNLIITNISSTAMHQLTVRDGQYNTEQLSTEINHQLQNVLGLSDLFFSIVDRCALFSSETHAYSFQFNSTTSHRVRSRLGWLLGFRKASIASPLSNATSIVSDCAIDVNPLRYIYLVLEDQSLGQNSFECPMFHTTTIPNVIARITLNGEAQNTILSASYEKGNLLSDLRFYKNKIKIQRIGVSLVDERGATIRNHGLDFSLLMEITHEL